MRLPRAHGGIEQPPLRRERDAVAAGFPVFAVGQGIILCGTAMDLAASGPPFGAGAGLWAAALALINIPRGFHPFVRGLGIVASILFALTALRIFAGAPLLPTPAPLPFYAYPVFVATLFGWMASLLRADGATGPDR